MKKAWNKFWRCTFWGLHSWTTPFIERGNVPSDEVIIAVKNGITKRVIEEFKSDCKMYCKFCGHDYNPDK